jgi:4-hydroxy-tetrahydrodipicolinate reductase
MVREGNGRASVTTSVRAGDIVGDHTLVLAGPYERLELTHRAHSREVFASGALDAALWIHRKKPGLYSFADMMGF